MEKKILIVAAVFGFLAIILGAFGAHALKKVLTLDQLTSFETGVKYQMYHALFLLFVGTSNMLTLKDKTIVFYLTVVGIFFFSGSIYVLTTSSITGIKSKIIGPITPIGGMFLLSSWGLLIYKLLIKK
ncbi:Probable transmembrane protein of unknown function [Flavobacterium indicum GPTSA100-9 = DSM 17447]|uniref:DUF423 domain-containing protein n=1 Tax=Flavobacterium indicum (strain DSM 17447 / CIP 109464 / GPTSA100-9) TaxID=1094466 RepID=H8XRV4_FLAIG|nr:DUF423 domain-containing protein [Flavobacterium indicum]CCG54538.1 Probable transmembrane protein of unknown function [Flavobacterium indicum GPTSA100-9 = DSM 17447]